MTSTIIMPARPQRVQIPAAAVDLEIEAQHIIGFLTYVAERMQLLLAGMGRQPFDMAELAKLHPSLVRDLQPYDAHAVVQAIMDLVTVAPTTNPLRRVVQQRRIRRLQQMMCDTAREFEHTTPATFGGTDEFLAEWRRRERTFHDMADRFWSARWVPSSFNSPVDMQLNATSLVQFMHLAATPALTAEAVLRNATSLVTFRDLRKWQYDFDRGYVVLCKLARAA